MKKFIALLTLGNLGDNKLVELIHLSLVRAKFCDLVEQAKSLSNNLPTVFLVGLFSLLDASFDQLMQGMIEKKLLPKTLRRRCVVTIMDLIRALESSHWSAIADISKPLFLDLKTPPVFYNGSLKWGIAMKQSLSD